MPDPKLFYLWTRRTLRHIDRFGRDVLKLDTDKKPEIPEASGLVRRLKAASDKVAKKKDAILKRMGKRGYDD